MKKSIYIVLAVVLIISCKDQKVVEEVIPEKQTEVETIQEVEVNKNKFDLNEYSITVDGYKTQSHQKYLSDPMVITDLPDGGYPEGKTAVVGSNICSFYPDVTVGNNSDTEKLQTEIIIPLGTIIPIFRKIESSESERIGMFEFQENWNFFYETEWEGQKGLVYGADLYGLKDANEANRISSLLYRKNGRYEEFYPITGYSLLKESLKDKLQEEKIVFQNVSHKEYGLGIGLPDDMISLYHKTAYSRKQPVFVTTDLAAHAQHLVFDRLFQWLEEEVFFVLVNELTEKFINILDNIEPKGDVEADIKNKALLYFKTADALLKLAPVKIENEESYRKEIVYQEVDRDKVLSEYPIEVVEEIGKMDLAQGFDQSSVFSFKESDVVYKEDYSQYKARGHYTKNGILTAYFKTMMWFGRIHFILAVEGPEPLQLGEVEKVSSSQDLSLKMTPIALYITDIVNKNNDLYDLWSKLFNPITDIIGLSDDLGIDDLLPLWKNKEVADFNEWVTDETNIYEFINSANNELKPPAYSGSSLFSGPSAGTEAERKPPMGFRLFGQRFTYDSYIHDQVSAPRLFERDMVSGLDIMKVSGSKTADILLAKKEYGEIPELENTLNLLQTNISQSDYDFWFKTYYSSILHQIRSLAIFEPGSGYYFTETPAWGIKSMLSSHGTWAELRHDTILYVKQSYAERAGDGDWEPTFRTLPIPEPFHYIEPNITFWETSVIAIQKLYNILDNHNLLDPESENVLMNLNECYSKATEIVKLEAEDKEISPEDNIWIRKISSILARLVLVHNEGGYVDDPDNLRMALVADVFTNAEKGLVLETAVGIPYRLYIALNDGQGGKRIAVGYVFSYYEFPHPMSDRLTDEKWKSIVYSNESDLTQYQPFWMDNVALPVEKK